MAYGVTGAFPNGWLGFELSVLRRLKFSSIALPFTGEPDLGVQLKRWKVRVAANDPRLWSYTKALALVENSAEWLTAEEIATLLDDTYIPRDKLDNPSLLKWFNDGDAWWFDNVRFNAERLESPYKRAVALTVGMLVGDYVLSFSDQTRQLREPLSLPKVFEQLAGIIPYPFENSIRSKASNLDVGAFIAECQGTDLLFLRLPPPMIHNQQVGNSMLSWREEWLRGGDDFWPELEKDQVGKIGSRIQSKQQYLGLFENLLRTGAHIPKWAIAHTDNRFISSDELTETVSALRKVDTVYSKDFSDLLGVRATIITAGS